MEIVQRRRGAVHIDERQEFPFSLIGLLHDGNDMISNFVAFDIVILQSWILVEQTPGQFHF